VPRAQVMWASNAFLLGAARRPAAYAYQYPVDPRDVTATRRPPATSETAVKSALMQSHELREALLHLR